MDGWMDGWIASLFFSLCQVPSSPAAEEGNSMWRSASTRCHLLLSIPSMGTSRHSVTFRCPLKNGFGKTFCTTDPFIHTVPMSIAGAGNPGAVRWVESLLHMLENLQMCSLPSRSQGSSSGFWRHHNSNCHFLVYFSLFSVYTTVEAGIQEISMTEE